MPFHISLVGRKNLSGEIYRQIVDAILDGRLRPGDRLSPSRELARALAVSRITVTAVYERLAGEGLVNSRRNAGTFVSEAVERAVRGPTRQQRGGEIQPRLLWQSIGLPTAFARPARFDFRTGLPDSLLFPHPAWQRSVFRALAAHETTPGVYEDPAGHRDLRTAIARQIGFSRGVDAAADDIIITNGTQQGLDIVARVLLAPGSIIAVEDPGYQPPRHLFKALDLRVVGVPVDHEGLVVDALPRGVRVVYVTPSHQYPLGVTMTLARRRALLTWAERNNAAIIEDDYDSEFRFGERPLEPLRTIDTAGRVIYVGSFSKTLLPTLRVGFLVTPPSLRLALSKAKFVGDWHTSTLAQAAVARFMEDGSFARHIRKMTKIYRERHQMLVNAISRDFGDHLDLVPSSTGLHVTAFARKASVQEIARVARLAFDRGVSLHPLSSFAVDVTARGGVVLGYGAIPTARIAEGLRLLRTCFDD